MNRRRLKEAMDQAVTEAFRAYGASFLKHPEPELEPEPEPTPRLHPAASKSSQSKGGTPCWNTSSPNP